MPKVLILENTAASGRLLSVGDVAELSDNDATILRHSGFATADAKRVAARQQEIDEATAARVAQAKRT